MSLYMSASLLASPVLPLPPPPSLPPDWAMSSLGCSPPSCRSSPCPRLLPRADWLREPRRLPRACCCCCWPRCPCDFGEPADGLEEESADSLLSGGRCSCSIRESRPLRMSRCTCLVLSPSS